MQCAESDYCSFNEGRMYPNLSQILPQSRKSAPGKMPERKNVSPNNDTHMLPWPSGKAESKGKAESNGWDQIGGTR